MIIAGINTKSIELTKDEEIKVITRLTEEFNGRGHYLSNFFTPSLLQWVSENIRNDFLPDVVDVITHRDKLVAELGEEVKTQHQNFMNEYECRVAEVARKEERIEDLELANKTFLEANKRLRKEIEELRAQLEEQKKAGLKLEALRGSLKWLLEE